MITGIGTDIIEIDRIKKACENPRFIDRVFTEREKDYSSSKVRSAQHFAARFASKEATMKALGKGFSFQDIEVVNNEEGKPEILLHGNAKEYAQKSGIDKIFLTISHSQNMAIAFVVMRKHIL
ncbi:MAG TPA: holo-ACP synthase [Candidatus Eremiobacteraeota bacterium]|nr:MAG: Holo-(acyl-carrier-protein) synthase [bacterium ADurb.Bin363]HPZ07278.1 holo-ACP synthase [Candidatus Eremiobacteraeota bacterium]